MGSSPATVKNLTDTGGVGSTTYGSINKVRWSNGGKTDVESFQVSTFDGQAAITVNANGSYRRVAERLTRVNQNIDTSVCFAGRGLWEAEGANERCGPIKKLNYSVTESGRTVTDTRCLQRRTYGGDSGGPVYGLRSDGRGRAAGTTIGVLTISGTYYNCYSMIDNIEAALNSTLVTW